VGHMAISANGRTHAIAQHLGYNPTPDITIHYSEDTMPRGTAGCIRDCEQWIGDQSFVVVQGASVLLDVDFDELIKQHKQTGAALTVAASSDGNGQLDGALKPTGVYVCEPVVFPYIKPRGFQDIKEQLIPRLSEAGLKVGAASIGGKVLTIRNEESYLNAMVCLLNDPRYRKSFVEHLVAKLPGLWIDPTAYLHPKARVIGPVYVGASAKLMADSLVIGPAIVGENCELGTEAVVHESILWSGAVVGAGAMVEQAVAASNSHVHQGVEVRGSIVLDTSLSTAERQSLSNSTDLTPAEINNPVGFWRRLWRSIRPGATAQAE